MHKLGFDNCTFSCANTLVLLLCTYLCAIWCAEDDIRVLTPRYLPGAKPAQVNFEQGNCCIRTCKMAEPSEQFATPELCRIAVRLPPFWPDRPAIWFAQAESQFELAAITRQRTKFNYVVAQLNQQQASEVEDIIIAPPEQEPYDRLKAELIRRLSMSREQRVRQLLSHEEMGDRKPSQFLRHLKSLAPDVPTDFLRTVWASRLPPHVQAILAGQTDGNLESAAQLADKICEVTTQPTTASVSPAVPDLMTALMERVEELTRQVAALQTAATRTRSTSREHGRSRSRDRSRKNNGNEEQSRSLCWYHQTFGTNARRCKWPCSHQDDGEPNQTADPKQGNSSSRR